MGQRTTVRMLMPQARMAAISLSADRRENTRIDATKSPSGIVHCIVSGKDTSAKRPTSPMGSPWRM